MDMLDDAYEESHFRTYRKKYPAIGYCSRVPDVECPHCGRTTLYNHDGLDIQFCFSCYKRADTGKWYAVDMFTYHLKFNTMPIGYIMLDDARFERIVAWEPARGIYAKHDFDITLASGKRAFAYHHTIVRVGALS